jgi:hypothetical protein
MTRDDWYAADPAKAERAAIVAWLRDNAGDEMSVPAATLRLTANAIEAGEHLTGDAHAQ